MSSPSYAASAASMASIDSSGGVPTRARSMPSAGEKVDCIANGSACPFHPVSGWSNRSW